MSTKENKQVVVRFYEEMINREDKSVIDQILAEDVIIHDTITGTGHGPEAYRRLLDMFDAAFPGHRATIDYIMAENDHVAVLHTHTATHTGEFMGLAGTSRQAVVNGLELFRLHDDKVVEFWRKDDDVSLLRQLGIMPAPQPA